MIIKNVEKLKRKHPNYENEINIIRQLVDGLVAVLNTDLLELAQNFDMIDWDIEIKNYLFSNQPKSIQCKDLGAKYNKDGFYELYEKTGFKFTTNIDHPTLINAITSTQAFDRMNIYQVANLYTVNFSKKDAYNGSMDVEAQNGSPVLKSYEINFN